MKKYYTLNWQVTNFLLYRRSINHANKALAGFFYRALEKLTENICIENGWKFIRQLLVLEHFSKLFLWIKLLPLYKSYKNFFESSFKFFKDPVEFVINNNRKQNNEKIKLMASEFLVLHNFCHHLKSRMTELFRLEKCKKKFLSSYKLQKWNKILNFEFLLWIQR